MQLCKTYHIQCKVVIATKHDNMYTFYAVNVYTRLNGMIHVFQILNLYWVDLSLLLLLSADIDECWDNTDNCSQGCNNTIGSYLCFCVDGYILDTDLHTCNGTVMCELLATCFIVTLSSCNLQMSMNVMLDLTHATLTPNA